jgi:pimeloyl-ACP methyl ester carboxylesterase
MTTFVLVHGAWHGGWCYRDTVKALRAKGHSALAPTLSGNGMYAHQGGQHITLETHIRDVCGLIEAEELNDVVLLGHSYGGMVITGVADRIPDRLKHLVYLDAFVPESGQSLISLLNTALPPEVAAVFVGGFRGAAAANNSGMMDPIPAEVFGIKAENRPWVDRRCVKQSLATFEMPLLIGGHAAHLPKTYILADSWDPSPFRHFAAKHTGGAGWNVTKLASSHDVMVDMPNELAGELLKLA